MSKLPKIALTGINAFPGSRVLSWLDSAISDSTHPLSQLYSGIVAIDIAPFAKKLENTAFYKLDLTATGTDQAMADIFSREQVKTVFHMAFHNSQHKGAETAHELHSIGTMYVLNACAQQKVKKIITNSTTLCYGAFPNNPNFLSEDHPLRGRSKGAYVRDRVDVEHQMERYQKHHGECQVIVLRFCSKLGPSVDNFASDYFSRAVCLTPLGYDPLVQLVHEEDVLEAFKLALMQEVRGAFNIVGRGVLPLLTVLRLCGRVALPVPTSMLYPIVGGLWQANLGIMPPRYVDFLRYVWVADGAKAEKVLGFTPKYSTRDTILDFAETQRLRQLHLDPTPDMAEKVA